MRGKTVISEILAETTRQAREAGFSARVTWAGGREATMRSAYGQVIQTPTANEGMLSIELRDGKRAVSTSLVSPTKEAIHEAIQWCAQRLPEMPENPYLGDLILQPTDLPEETLGLQEIPDVGDDLSIKADTFSKMRGVTPEGLVLSGRFFTAARELAVANTEDLLRYATAHASYFAVVASDETGLSTYAERSALMPVDVDVDGAIEEVLASAARIRKLPEVDPFDDEKGSRTYDLIAKPTAVGSWFEWLCYATFNGLDVHEGTSFFAKKALGEMVTGEDVTITDDWTHSDVIPMPFDLNGMTSERVSLIENGRYRGMTYGLSAAKKSGVEPTGHFASIPWSVVMTGGDETFDGLVAKSTNPTIVATYFNYPSMPDPENALFTATTRHGTFLVEDGEYVAVCPALRLRMTTFEALERLDGMTQSVLTMDHENYGWGTPTSFFPICKVVPAMRLRDIDFVGSAN